MISRTEFYISILIIAGLISYLLWGNRSEYELKKAQLDVKDSIVMAQRDSALAHAMQSDIKSDSLKNVINRKENEIKNIQIKYVYIKESVVRLSADSSLAFFLRAVH